MTDSFVREGVHSLEFLLSEANGSRSRETGVLKETETVIPGTILVWDSGKLEATEGALDGSDDLDEDIAGIAAYAVDASDDDMPITYIARDAEVSEAALVWPAVDGDGKKRAALKVALGTIGIQVREGLTVPSS